MKMIFRKALVGAASACVLMSVAACGQAGLAGMAQGTWKCQMGGVQFATVAISGDGTWTNDWIDNPDQHTGTWKLDGTTLRVEEDGKGEVATLDGVSIDNTKGSSDGISWDYRDGKLNLKIAYQNGTLVCSK